jgi:hypothetical protein
VLPAGKRKKFSVWAAWAFESYQVIIGAQPKSAPTLRIMAVHLPIHRAVWCISVIEFVLKGSFGCCRDCFGRAEFWLAHLAKWCRSLPSSLCWWSITFSHVHLEIPGASGWTPFKNRTLVKHLRLPIAWNHFQICKSHACFLLCDRLGGGSSKVS